MEKLSDGLLKVYAGWVDWDDGVQKDMTKIAAELLALRQQVAKINEFTDEPLFAGRKDFIVHVTAKELLQKIVNNPKEHLDTFTIVALAHSLILKREEVAALRQQVRWVPVAERLPEPANYYWCSLRNLTEYVWQDKIYYFSDRRWDTFAEVTHWQPLPLPPAQEVG